MLITDKSDPADRLFDEHDQRNLIGNANVVLIAAMTFGSPSYASAVNSGYQVNGVVGVFILIGIICPLVIYLFMRSTAIGDYLRWLVPSFLCLIAVVNGFTAYHIMPRSHRVTELACAAAFVAVNLYWTQRSLNPAPPPHN